MKLRSVILGSCLSIFSMSLYASECNGHLAYGSPSETDQLLCRDGFALGYNYEHKAPDWVSYKLTRESVSTNAVPRKNIFTIDREIPSEFRAGHNDFRGSGYDRGHMAPASSMDYSFDAMKQSFMLSNMVPQKPGFNRYGFGYYGAWGALEDFVRDWAVSRGEIMVITGPIYHQVIDVIGDGIEVPSHFFKVVYDPSIQASIAFVLPHKENTAAQLEKYVTTIDCVESLSGLNFLATMDDTFEADLENGMAYDFNYWTMRDGNEDIHSCSIDTMTIAHSNSNI